MDKNTIVGLVLIGAVLIGWGYLTKPTPEQIERSRQMRDSIQLVNQARSVEALRNEQEIKTNQIISEPKAENASNEAQMGSFDVAQTGENEFYTIENEILKVIISKRGGRPYSVQLKEFQTFDSLPLYIFNGDTTVFGFTFLAQNAAQPIKTNNLFWEKSASYSTDTAEILKIRLTADNEKYIEYVYSLKKDDYLLDFSVEIVNMANVIRNDYIAFDWSYMIPSTEQSLKWERNRSTVYYKYKAGEIDYLSETSNDNIKLTEKVQWVGFKAHFFNTVIVAKESLNEVQLKSEVLTSNNHVKEMSLNTYIPYSGGAEEKHDFTFYFGPNQFYQLESYNMDFEKMIPLGWGVFRWVNRGIIIPLFNFLNMFIGSYGIIILILTLIIKIVLFPLTFKSYLSTARMKVLKPEIDEINKKYPDRNDAVKKQEATMALYKKAGVSPMGGCLPTLLQMPVLIAMFTFFPSSFELRQEAFLWAVDLSSYDSILNLPFNIPFYGDHVSLFCLLMAITNIIYVKIGDQSAMSSSAMPGMKGMMYMMPVMMLFIFNDYASGLSYYYFLSLLITIGQTMIFRHFVDENKILAQIKANKSKPIKKSNFQKRVEEAARQKGIQPRK